jgi:hypothetical protein
MSKTLDLEYYKVEFNDESKETKCIQIVICKTSNPRKKQYCLNFLNKYWKCFEIERNHKVQYDYDTKLFFTKIIIDYKSIKDLIHYIWIFINQYLKPS